MKHLIYILLFSQICSCMPGVFGEYTDGIATICGETETRIMCGTAWTRDEQGILVTNEHVVRDWRGWNSVRYWVTDEEKKIYYDILTPIFMSRTFDVAFLEVNLPDGHEPYPYRPCNRAKLWESVTIVGGANEHMDGQLIQEGELTFAAGHISFLTRRTFWAKIETEHGNSGSPLFATRDNMNTCVAGMHRGRSASNHAMGPRISTIEWLYRQSGIEGVEGR